MVNNFLIIKLRYSGVGLAPIGLTPTVFLSERIGLISLEFKRAPSGRFSSVLPSSAWLGY
jgi:hypothetical protein